MKWSEFKKKVDKELDGRDLDIDYIDLPTFIEHMDIFVDSDSGTFEVH